METVYLNSEIAPELPVSNTVRRVVTVLGFFLALAILLGGFLVGQYYLTPAGVLRVTTTSGIGTVLLNGKNVGGVTYRSNLRPGSYNVTVSDNAHDFQMWSGLLKVRPSILTNVNLDLGTSSAFSSSVITSLIPGGRFVVSSYPTGATVIVDGHKIGTTYLTSTTVSPGNHTVSIQKLGYLTKTIQIAITRGYGLNIVASLFKNPDFGVTDIQTDTLVPSTTTTLAVVSRSVSGLDKIGGTRPAPAHQQWTSVHFFNLSTTDSSIATHPLTWLRGYYYYAIYELKLPDIPFQYLIDESGKIYEGSFGGANSVSFDPSSSLAAVATPPTAVPGVVMVGYLGSSGNVSSAAMTSYHNLVAWLGRAGALPAPQVKILPTSVGFLRVRSAPSLGASQIGTVTPGNTYPYVTAQSSWTEIKLLNGSLGWVSSQYVVKI